SQSKNVLCIMNNNFGDATRIIAENGTIFVLTSTYTTMNFLGFKSDHKIITTSFTLAETINAESVYPPLYDAINSVLYFVTFGDSHYKLYAIDLSDLNLGQIDSFEFDPSEKISKPFLTLDNILTAKKVLVVSSAG